MQSLSVTCAAALVITGICFLANNLLITRLRQKNTYKSDKLISLHVTASVFMFVFMVMNILILIMILTAD